MGASAPNGAFKTVDAPMVSKTLTDVAARAAKPREKPYKLAAGGGLYLEVMPRFAIWFLRTVKGPTALTPMHPHP